MQSNGSQQAVAMQGNEPQQIIATQGEEQMQNKRTRNKTQCKTKKPQVNNTKTPLGFYIPFLAWSPLMEAPP